MSKPEDGPQEPTFSPGNGPERQPEAEQARSRQAGQSFQPGFVGPKVGSAAGETSSVEAGSNSQPDVTTYFINPSSERGKVGLVLNDIWEVRRLIAQGGMGEVYEGIELNTGETVAIKFLLPHLAADPKIQALFLDEARTLVRLSKSNVAQSNTALVQYRVCANDRNLGETYIVMEFVKGPTLAEALPSLKPSSQQILQFAKLLTSGLAFAHQVDLIHRDVSPKNILVPDGNLHLAKIIDFGIAKNLAAGDKTHFGGGFTGTLSYSAPEQFAERADSRTSPIGPWTDVYSLALVILAVANRKPVAMGTSIAEAVEKRKKIPDLSALPKEMRPVLAEMLAPDPVKRLRSMPAVLDALNKITLSVPKILPKRRIPVVASVAVLIGVASAGVLWFLPGGGPSADEIRQRVTSSLENSDCTWLNLDSIAQNGGPARVKLSGVAGNLPAITNAVIKAGGVPMEFDTTDVSTVGRQACGPLNAFRRLREPASSGGPSLAVEQKQFRLGNDPDFCPADRLRQARVSVNLRPGDASSDFTLLGLESNGQMQQLIASRSDFDSARAQNPERAPNLGGDIYRMSFCVDEASAQSSPNGLVGLVLVKGLGPFSLELDPNASKASVVPDDWPMRFIAKGEAQRWTTQMAWYQILGG